MLLRQHVLRLYPLETDGRHLLAGLGLGHLVQGEDRDRRILRTIFDQHDAESYLALSESLISGRGYTRSQDPLYYVSHTTWPPGVPLLLAPYALLAGMPANFLVIKIGMIGYGVIGIILAYLYSLRVTKSIATRLVRTAVEKSATVGAG